ncbi:MAG: hypothetical protein NVS3B10_00320 [Polyangiales bacterium]
MLRLPASRNGQAVFAIDPSALDGDPAPLVAALVAAHEAHESNTNAPTGSPAVDPDHREG